MLHVAVINGRLASVFRAHAPSTGNSWHAPCSLGNRRQKPFHRRGERLVSDLPHCAVDRWKFLGHVPRETNFHAGPCLSVAKCLS